MSEAESAGRNNTPENNRSRTEAGGVSPGMPGMGPHRGFGARRGMAVAKPKQFKATVKRLWKYFGGERKLLALVFGLVAVGAVLSLMGPYLIGRSIDAVTPGRGGVKFNLLMITVMILLAAYLSDGIAVFFQGWLMAGVSQRIVQNIRKTLFAKLQKIPVAYFDCHAHGDLMSRLSNDIDNISATISQSTTQLMSHAIIITGSLVMMLVLSPWLTFASLITVPLVILLTRIVTKRTRVLFKEQQAILGNLNGQIEETISGIEVVKAFNHEEQVMAEFEKYNSGLCEIGIKALIWSGYIMPLMNVINNIGFTAVAGAGGILAVKGMVTVGVIASFLSYSRQFARPLNEIANIYNTLLTALAGAERVFEILDEPEEAGDRVNAEIMEHPQGDVIFEAVSFGYRPEVPVLEEINFEVTAGSTIALVGPTGAGKTTIVNLLARFYDVTSGRILIDGRDVRDYTRDSLRNCFGIVLQDTYLFSGTIRENIRYGRPSATDAEIIAAARTANADSFIKRLPGGYGTLLTESGSNLSQGQRQLIAIARAVLADAPILILDEATSSVDTRTEMHIQAAMLKLMEGRTSFIIAHRLSTIRDADRIMVIDNGRIVEQGDHRTLLQSGGIYQRLYSSQLKGGEENESI